jgi:hypothetical protein
MKDSEDKLDEMRYSYDKKLNEMINKLQEKEKECLKIKNKSEKI